MSREWSISLPSSLNPVSAVANGDSWDPAITSSVALVQSWTIAIQTARMPTHGAPSVLWVVSCHIPNRPVGYNYREQAKMPWGVAEELWVFAGLNLEGTYQWI